MSLDNGKRAYKAVLMMNDNNNKEDHEQKAKYIIKPWVQPTGDDTIDNSIFRKFLKYCNPKIHLDANTFIFSNEHRELHFIKYPQTYLRIFCYLKMRTFFEKFFFFLEQ